MLKSARGFLRRAFDAIDLAFCKLHRIQFGAPWRADEVHRC